MNLAPPRARLVTRADLGAALVLLALTVLLFFPAATLQGVVFYGDAANYLPRLAFNTRALLAGRLPEWNPYLAGGYPHIADPGAMTFYPLQYPFFVLLPTFAAFNYYLLFHYILAGVGMYAFARMLGVTRWGALLAGIMYLASGFMLAHFQHVNIIIAASWIPWLMLCVEWIWKETSLRAWAFGTIVVGLQILGGHIQIVAYGLLLAAAYTAFHILNAWRDHKRLDRAFVRAMVLPCALIAGMVALGIALASVQIIPTYELINFTQRGGRISYEFATSFSLPPERLVTLLAPYFFGGPKWGVVWGRGSFLELAGYVGIVGLTIAILGAFTWRRDRRVWFFIGLALVSLLLALGGFTPLYRIVFLFPFLNTMRAPGRFLLLADFAFAMLAAYGLDMFRLYLTRQAQTRAVKIFALVIALAAIVAIGARFFLSQFPNPSKSISGALAALDPFQPVLLIPFAFAIFTLLWLISARWLTPNRFAAVGVALAALELIVQGSGLYYNAVAPPEAYALDPELTAYFQPTNEFRVYHPLKGEKNLFDLLDAGDHATYRKIFGERFDGGQGMLLNIPMFSGYGVESQRFWNLEAWMDQQIGTARAREAARALALMSVKYIGTQRDAGKGFRLRVKGEYANTYENREFLPRAFLVDQTITVMDPEQLLPTLLQGDFDLSQKAVVEENIPLPSDSAEPLQGKVVLEQVNPELVRIHVTTNRPALLVLNDNYFPGWNAYVDGAPTKIYRANYLARAVIAPQGEHIIEFRYEPSSVQIGLGVSGIAALGLLALLGIGLWARRGKRKKSTSIEKRTT